MKKSCILIILHPITYLIDQVQLKNIGILILKDPVDFHGIEPEIQKVNTTFYSIIFVLKLMILISLTLYSWSVFQLWNK